MSTIEQLDRAIGLMTQVLREWVRNEPKNQLMDHIRYFGVRHMSWLGQRVMLEGKLRDLIKERKRLADKKPE